MPIFNWLNKFLLFFIISFIGPGCATVVPLNGLPLDIDEFNEPYSILKKKYPDIQSYSEITNIFNLKAISEEELIGSMGDPIKVERNWSTS